MNDKIHDNTKALGYCCPYAFFGCNQRKTDSKAKLAGKAGVSLRTITYCKLRIKQGDMKCEDKPNCRAAEIERKISGS